MAKAGTRPKQKQKKTMTIDKEQSERFIETARKLDVDESGEKFESAFKKMVNQKSKVPSSE